MREWHSVGVRASVVCLPFNRCAKCLGQHSSVLTISMYYSGVGTEIDLQQRMIKGEKATEASVTVVGKVIYTAIGDKTGPYFSLPDARYVSTAVSICC